MQVTHAAEERQLELARKVAEATANQLQDQIEKDMAILRQRIPDAEAKAAAAAQDVKYVKDRQRQMTCHLICFGLAPLLATVLQDRNPMVPRVAEEQLRGADRA